MQGYFDELTMEMNLISPTLTAKQTDIVVHREVTLPKRKRKERKIIIKL